MSARFRLFTFSKPRRVVALCTRTQGSATASGKPKNTWAHVSPSYEGGETNEKIAKELKLSRDKVQKPKGDRKKRARNTGVGHRK